MYEDTTKVPVFQIALTRSFLVIDARMDAGPRRATSQYMPYPTQVTEQELASVCPHMHHGDN
jgi:hypothetical protein